MKYFPEKLTLTWLKHAYSTRQLTPRELVMQIIRRANENMQKNIWIIPPTPQFCEQYLVALENKDKNLPLWGVPFAIKDNIDLAGFPTTAACPAYAYTPTANAFVVQKLIEAGAFPVGKTNLDQFATGLVGTRSPYGEVHNAFNGELISGGSSSGSAVAVASGLACFSLGTDTAGSGRVPAALHSLVGYKPPVGSWSASGVVPACESLDCVTVFANHLKDALAVDLIARGVDSNYMYSRAFHSPRLSAPKTIFLPKQPPSFFGNYADIYRQKWENSVKRLANLNIDIQYIDCSLFENAAKILYNGSYIAERYEALGEFVRTHENDVFPVTKTILESGSNLAAHNLFSDLHTLQQYKLMAATLLENAVLVLPTCGGTFTREQVRNNPIETNSQMGLFTNHCNLLDLCAVAVPENSNDTLIPFGITLFTTAQNEGLLQHCAHLFIQSETVCIAVCGLHKQGGSLEWQLTQLGATFSRTAKTSPSYKLEQLNTTPPKPGLFRVSNGNSIDLELFNLPIKNLGEFMNNVRFPHNIGDIELADGSWVKGFVCG